MLKGISLAALLIVAVIDGYKGHQEYVGLLQENAYIMGYEKAEQDRFNEYAEIAQLIHGPVIPVPERKPI